MKIKKKKQFDADYSALMLKTDTTYSSAHMKCGREMNQNTQIARILSMQVRLTRGLITVTITKWESAAFQIQSSPLITNTSGN